MVKLTPRQVDAVLDALPVHAYYPYYGGDPEYSAMRIRAEDEEWRKMVRERLEMLEVDEELAKDTERIKREITSTIGAMDPLKFVQELPEGLGVLTRAELDDIVSIFDGWYPETLRIGDEIQHVPRSDIPLDDETALYLPRPSTLWIITEMEANRHKEYIRGKLRNTAVVSGSSEREREARRLFVHRLKGVLYERFSKATLAAGTAVGVIAGQSMGERVTQNTLNVHKAPGVAAARQAAASFPRTTELYNVSVPKVPSSSIYFKAPQTYSTLKTLSYKLRNVAVKSVLLSQYPIVFRRDLTGADALRSVGGVGAEWHPRFERAFPPSLARSFDPPEHVLRLLLDRDLLYAYRVSPKVVAETIERHANGKVRCLYTPMGGLPMGVAVGNVQNSYPIVDVYQQLGATSTKKGRGGGKGKEHEVEEGEGEGEGTETTLSFAAGAEYQLRELFSKYVEFHICGVPGIKQLHPYFLPLVRFFTVHQVEGSEDAFELRFDTNLMRVEGVKGEQIYRYVQWRLESLGLSGTATTRLSRARVALTGISRQTADAIKNYSAIEPLSTFASIVSDTSLPDHPEDTENPGPYRRVSFRVDAEMLERYGFTPYRSAPAKLVGMILRELMPRQTSIADSVVTVVLDLMAYEKLMKPPGLHSIVRVVSDRITDPDKEEHTLEVDFVSSRMRGEHPLARTIQYAVKESGAFNEKERLTYADKERKVVRTYGLVLTMTKDSYDRFIRAYDLSMASAGTSTSTGTSTGASTGTSTRRWETEILVDVSTVIPHYNQWSYQTIGSNLKEVLALPEVNPVCTTSDDPNEIFRLFGIEAVAAYLLAGLNEVSNQKRDIDVAHIMEIVDGMCNKAEPHPVNRHGLADQGAEALTKASMEQASRTFTLNAFVGETDAGQSPASCLLLSTQVNVGSKVADVKMKETFMPFGARSREVEEGRGGRGRGGGGTGRGGGDAGRGGGAPRFRPGMGGGTLGAGRGSARSARPSVPSSLGPSRAVSTIMNLD
jgi:hypothetical protein